MIPISKPHIGEEEKKAVLDVLDSGMLVQGKKVEELEQQFSAYTGTQHCIATSSGTTALHLALLASGLGKGDEVITTPFTFVSTTNAILFTGATPVFVDIDDKSFNINPDLIKEKITPQTKALLIVHLFGQPCDMEKITVICQQHNLTLIEDACQAHGAMFNDKQVGSFGIGCFSLYATKNITGGEGGLITVDNAQMADKLRLLRNHGSSTKNIHEIIGYNYRLTDIHAVIALEQLKKIDTFTQTRTENARYLTEHITNKGIVTPQLFDDSTHVYHQYTIKVTSDFPIGRDALIELLIKEGIHASVFYPLPVYKQGAYANIFSGMRLPVVEQVCNEVISLPVHPLVTPNDLNKIVTVINNVK